MLGQGKPASQWLPFGENYRLHHSGMQTTFTRREPNSMLLNSPVLQNCFTRPVYRKSQEQNIQLPCSSSTKLSPAPTSEALRPTSVGTVWGLAPGTQACVLCSSEDNGKGVGSSSTSHALIPGGLAVDLCMGCFVSQMPKLDLIEIGKMVKSSSC